MRFFKLLFALLFFAAVPEETFSQRSQAKGFGDFIYWGVNADHAVTRVRFPDGIKAERFELRAGDCYKSDCKTDRERVEFSQRKGTPLGKSVWVGWSLYVPNDFPRLGPLKNVKLAQFHQTGGSGPEILFELHDGKYQAVLKSPFVRDADPMRPKGDFKLFTLASRTEIIGRWTRFAVNVKWSRTDDGFFKIYKNGALVAQYNGPTTNDDEPVYFRYGIYRSFVSRCGKPCPTQVAYYRDVKQGRTLAQISK
jgi:hypothetical protein